ncbi:heparinase II/III family protein [Saccharicrinis sp. FJH54]|uniref:heparinase II/III family protein n=1 Tax=Saccharicrinis sp. FJH54 TaxID=3344665 RepID=UPI0035D47DC2
MPSAGYYIKLAKKMPLKKVIPRFFSFLRRILSEYIYKLNRIFFAYKTRSGISLLNYTLPLQNNITIDPAVQNTLSDYYISHRFDLLGSGWVGVGYGDDSLGLEGSHYSMNVKIENFDKKGEWLRKILRKNDFRKSASIWKMINDENYKPIDWQKDFKSGFRWSNKTYFKNCRKNIVGELKGVDIKVPWELSRLQHFTQLALFAYSTNLKDKYIYEFRCQILDFIATNPPQMGVCWTCTMDVAIRVTNILLSYFMFKPLDDTGILDDEFEKVLAESVFEHGKHIFDNLEWHYELTSNHYLSNIAGLLFASAYLQDDKDVNKWLSFSANELINEFDKQFYTDGSSCEASTSYHRLSGEMVLYSTALLSGLGKQKTAILRDFSRYNSKLPSRLRSEQQFSIENDKFQFPEWYISRLYKLSEFTKICTKQNGEVVQIGDNDSGRFVKLSPVGKLISVIKAEEKYLNLKGYAKLISGYAKNNELFWDENILNHSTFLWLSEKLFKNKTNSSSDTPESQIIGLLANNRMLDTTSDSTITFKTDANTSKTLNYIHESAIKIPVELLEEIQSDKQLYQYPDFGLIVIKSRHLFLSIMLGHRARKYCNWGHSHNDKLSVELMIDNNTFFSDPGTYLYTPVKNQRMRFISTSAHSTCFIDDKEQTDFKDIFTVNPDYDISINVLNKDQIDLVLKYKDIEHRRIIEFKNEAVYITDQSNKPINDKAIKFPYFSNGYGKLMYSEI